MMLLAMKTRMLSCQMGNGQGNGNENVKKGSKSKTTILHVQHAFWYISLLSVHDHYVKFPHATFCEAAPPARHFFLLFLPQLG